MKNVALALLLTSSLSCFTIEAQVKKTETTVKVGIDLVNVKDDKVTVTVTPPKITSNEIQYRLPKTVPGTYSSDNYGRFIEDIKALDAKGKELIITKSDANSWTITNAKNLVKITYSVNDTFDTEKGEGFGKEDVFLQQEQTLTKEKLHVEHTWFCWLLFRFFKYTLPGYN